jgi:hypothetical protein
MKIITTLPAGAPLIDRVVDVIEHNPEASLQSSWAERATDNTNMRVSADNFPCGTTACFAGWTVLLAGYKIEFLEGSTTADYTSDGRSISDLARSLLRLDYMQTERLFYETGDLAEIRNTVAEIKAEKATLAKFEE